MSWISYDLLAVGDTVNGRALIACPKCGKPGLHDSVRPWIVHKENRTMYGGTEQRICHIPFKVSQDLAKQQQA